MKIELSIFAKPIEEQLSDNGYKFKKDTHKDLYSKLIHSWNMIRMHSISTDGESDKMATRLMRKLEKDIEKI